jgi:iron complex transport system substrate-binding protein
MRRLFIWGVLFLVLSSSLFAVTVTDFEGRVLTINTHPERIISLAPIATRILVQFNILDRVIGLDQKSIDMDLLPVPISGRGNAIANLGNAKSVNEEAILRLRPDLIITQYDKETADRLSGRIGVPVLCIQNRGGLMDYELFEIMGKVLFAECRANELVTYMKVMVARAENIARNNGNANSPRVYVATDTSLLNTFPQDPIIAICGGRNAAAEITVMNYWGGATVDLEFILRSRPDIIIVWIPFDAPQKIDELKRTIRRREFTNIPAIRTNRIYSFLEATSGKDYFYTMVSISETLYHLYPNQYNEQTLEQDVKAHLSLFYPLVSYTEYKRLRDRITITQ